MNRLLYSFVICLFVLSMDTHRPNGLNCEVFMLDDVLPQSIGQLVQNSPVLWSSQGIYYSDLSQISLFFDRSQSWLLQSSVLRVFLPHFLNDHVVISLSQFLVHSAGI